MPIRQSPNLSDGYFKAYDHASSYVIRELNLINNRLTWILTIHGFLYATYGFTLQKQMETYEKIKDIHTHLYPLCDVITQSEFFLLLISSVGIAISFYGFISINAACDAMHSVADTFFVSNASRHRLGSVIIPIRRSKLRAYLVLMLSYIRYFCFNKTSSLVPYSNFYISKYGAILPYLLGGGFAVTDTRGNKSSNIIPWILLTGWSISIIVLGFVWHSSRHIGCNIF